MRDKSRRVNCSHKGVIVKSVATAIGSKMDYKPHTFTFNIFILYHIVFMKLNFFFIILIQKYNS